MYVPNVIKCGKQMIQINNKIINNKIINNKIINNKIINNYIKYKIELNNFLLIYINNHIII
jgi:hypothetical protein